jgi:thymidylate kinase
MVVPLSRLNGTRVRRPLLLELAGPAGVGKSTLSDALSQRLQGRPGTIWGLPVLPLLGNGMRLIPTFRGLWLDSSSPLWGETRHMVRLETLHQVIRRAAPPGDDVVIFDEGPIFSMAWLRGFGHETLRGESSTDWWQPTLRRWSSVMDAVVVLDAPDELLARRIRARPQWHEVKELPEPEIARWMARFRQALDWVLVELVRYGGPAVVRLSTSDEPVERMADRVIEALQETHCGR